MAGITVYSAPEDGRKGRPKYVEQTGAAKGILRLPLRWQRVVHNDVDYIEGQ